MRDLDREECLQNEQYECYVYDNYQQGDIFADTENGRKAFKYWSFEEVDLAGLSFVTLDELQG